MKPKINPRPGDFDSSKDSVFPELPGYVFVFGSNLAGIHGGGAAATARKKYGAMNGIGEGLMGLGKGINGTLSYALPTKGFDLEILPLIVIDYFVDRLYSETVNHEDLVWFVTRVGCGLSGYDDAQMSQLFSRYYWEDNVILPRGWV